MAIFTASILKSTTQDESKIAQRWAAYQNFLAKTEFIKTVKEEKYQDGFLHDLYNALKFQNNKNLVFISTKLEY